MPAMDTTVKHFSNLMTNSGSFLANLNNTAGTLITLLDACLVNGFGTVTATGVTVSSGVATATFSVAHPFLANTVALVDGATPSGLNGEHKVISTTSTTVTFDAFGVVDGAATGTITMKLAPLGWEKTYSGTNKAVYRQTDITGTRLYLRVDDTFGGHARVRGYESMSGVDTGTNPFPRVEQQADSTLCWPKSASATAKRWWLIGNGKIFYFGVRGYDDSLPERGANQTVAFGDIQAAKSDDAYRCFLAAVNQTNAADSNYRYNVLKYVTDNNWAPRYFPRAYTQVGLPVTWSVFTFATAAGTDAIMGHTTPGFAYPNLADTGIYIYDAFVYENAATAIRGTLPGVYCPLHYITYTEIYNDSYLNEFVPYSRKMLWKAINCNQNGGVFFDVTGPWGN